MYYDTRYIVGNCINSTSTSDSTRTQATTRGWNDGLHFQSNAPSCNREGHRRLDDSTQHDHLQLNSRVFSCDTIATKYHCRKGLIISFLNHIIHWPFIFFIKIPYWIIIYWNQGHGQRRDLYTHMYNYNIVPICKYCIFQVIITYITDCVFLSINLSMSNHPFVSCSIRPVILYIIYPTI